MNLTGALPLPHSGSSLNGRRVLLFYLTDEGNKILGNKPTSLRPEMVTELSIYFFQNMKTAFSQ